MKSLGEIYWDINHQCNENKISFSDEHMMLFHAAEEYVEELLKHDQWESIVKNDIDYLKASSIIRRTQKGYSEGAESFLSYLHKELERYGLRIDDCDIPPVKETTQHKSIPNTGNNECPNTGEDSESKPMTKDEIIQSLEAKDAFVPLKTINLYGVYYDRLLKGKITNEDGKSKTLEIIRKVCEKDEENIKLFKYCVERADISNLVNTGRKSYARLFMNDIASDFQEQEKFRKAAAKSFGIKEVGGVGGDYKKNYRLLMKGLFSDDADYRKGNS